MKLTKVKPKNLAEAFQSLDIKMAFVNAKGKEVSSPAKCRDFLGDCIWSKDTQKKVDIYKFIYDFKTKPYDDEVLRLSLKFPTLETKAIFESNFYKLQEKDALANTISSKVYQVEDYDDTLIIEADKNWQQSPWKIALYTFYLKCISYPTEKDLKSPEKEYIVNLTEEKEDKLLSKVTTPTKYIADSIYVQHSRTGFNSILTEYALPALVSEVML